MRSLNRIRFNGQYVKLQSRKTAISLFDMVMNLVWHLNTSETQEILITIFLGLSLTILRFFLNLYKFESYLVPTLTMWKYSVILIYGSINSF